MTVAEFYAEVMVALRELGIAVRINEMPNEIPGAVPFPEDRAHAAYDRDAAQRFWRVLLRSHDGVLAFPHRLSRQGEPGAFLLGQLRSRGDALFRPPGAAASGRRAEPAGRGRARGLFARSVERGLLAGRRRRSTIRRSIPTPIRRREGFAAAKVAAGRGVLVEGARRIHPAL